MRKSDRVSVLYKYNSCCAYCGKLLTLKTMQVDHIQPKSVGGKDELENYNPSCRRCNHYKRSLTLEKYREYLRKLDERLKKIYIVNVAVDYGMMAIQPFDGEFYYEKLERWKNEEVN